MLENRNQRIAVGVVAGLVVLGGIGVALMGGGDDAAAPATTTTTVGHHRPPPRRRRRRWPRSPASPATTAIGSARPALVVKIDNVAAEGPTAGGHQPGRRRVRGERRGQRHPAARRLPVDRLRARRPGALGPHHRHRHRVRPAPAVLRVERRQRHLRSADPGGRHRRRRLRRPLRRVLPGAEPQGPRQPDAQVDRHHPGDAGRGLVAAAGAVPVPRRRAAARPPRGVRRRAHQPSAPAAAARRWSTGGTAPDGPAPRPARPTSTRPGSRWRPPT